MTEDDWDRLIRRIGEQKCTPFLGAGASAALLPSGRRLAADWAERDGYPFDDGSELPRVAQFVSYKDDGIVPRERVQHLIAEAGAPSFGSESPHAVLAGLRLPLYITTNYDDFMATALRERPDPEGGRCEPKVEICRWNTLVDDYGERHLEAGYEPSPDAPVVYHLHGHHEFLQSMVLTEDDYLEFLVRLTRDPLFLPEPVRKALTGTSLLFVGYSLADWDFRVLLRVIQGNIGRDLIYPSIAVQLEPTATADPEQAKAFLDKYFAQHLKNVVMYWGPADQFLAELRARLDAVIVPEPTDG